MPAANEPGRYKKKEIPHQYKYCLHLSNLKFGRIFLILNQDLKIVNILKNADGVYLYVY